MILDCFPFFNELDILEIRLRELDSFVDRFVAIQSVETHAGQPKPIYLDPSAPRWREWEGRLETVILPAMPQATDRWQRENAPRHAITEILADSSPDALVIISDADEIPNRYALESMRAVVTADRWVGFTANCYFYYLNLKTPKRFRCIALAQVATVRALGAQAIRDAKRRPPIGPIAGGWHFSYMGGVDRIIEKLGAFAHAEYDTPAMKDRAFLEDRIRARQDIFGHVPKRFHRIDVAELPKEVWSQPDKYAHLLLTEAA